MMMGEILRPWGGTRLSPGCPRDDHGGLPRVHRTMPAPLGSGSVISAVNSGSPLTPDPGSLIGCGEEHCRSRRGKEEGNLPPESCRDFKEKARAGEFSCAKTIFCSSLQKSLFLLMDLEHFAHRKQKLLQSVAPPQLLPGPCSALAAPRVAFLALLEGAALSCLPFTQGSRSLGCARVMEGARHGLYPWKLWAPPRAILASHRRAAVVGGWCAEWGLGSQRSLMGCDGSSRACGCRLPSRGTGLRQLGGALVGRCLPWHCSASARGCGMPPIRWPSATGPAVAPAR